MTMQFKQVAETLLNASDYLAVFGSVQDGEDVAAHIKRTYRQLARAVHPDTHSADAVEHALATKAFGALGRLHDQATSCAKAGTYGQQVTLLTVATRRAEHCFRSVRAGGDLTTTYAAETTLKSGETLQTFCKVAKQAADADLLQAEARALKRLRGDGTDSTLHVFVPELVDAFSYQSPRRTKLQVNVLNRLDGFYDLVHIKRAFPKGVHILHGAWMWRRLLYVLGFAHQHQVVHGAVLPPHIMILPAEHGVVLADWCYASLAEDGEVFEPIKAIVSDYKEWYPDEVLNKQNPGSATDIAMAARTMIDLLGGDPLTGNFQANHPLPRPFRAYFRGCLQTTQASRPQDAWQLLAEFDELFERLGPPFYPRRFRAFVVPQ